MKKFLSIIIILLLAVPNVMLAQSDSIVGRAACCLELGSPLDVEKGSIRLTLENDFFGGAFTKVGVDEAYASTPYAFANIGAGVEYAYATNKTLEANVHFAFLNIVVDWEDYYFGGWNYTVGIMHRWYRGHWTFGAGLSFERRYAKYNVQHYENGPPEYNPDPYYVYGENEFKNIHYNLGADLMAGWGKRKWWIGLRYSPRFIVKDSFNYIETKYPLLPVKSYTGHADHQISLMIRFAFDIAKFSR